MRIVGLLSAQIPIRGPEESGCVTSFEWLIAIFAFFLLTPSEGDCSEFTYFKLTDIEGKLKLGYSFNETKLFSENTSTFEKRPARAQELSMNTMSYIFHPNLVEMEFGGGVRLDQDKLINSRGTESSSGTVYDVSGRWNFLKQKPYPFNIYFTQSHPTKSVGIADVLTLETKSYGMSFFLRKPLVRSPISLYADHSQNKGEGSQSIIDDTTDSLTLSMRSNIGNYGTGQLGLSTVSKKSKSGSTNLPLVESESTTDSLDWSGRMLFGADRTVEMTNYLLLSRDEQSNTIDRDRAQFYNSLNWDLSKALVLYNTYSYSGTKYETNKTENHNIVIGATEHVTSAWDVSSYVEALRESSSEFERATDSVAGSVNYQGEINDRWSSSAGYTAQYRLTSQITEQHTVSVRDESHVLAGLTAVPLGNEFVLAGSVVVSNFNHTQTYVENIDYRVTVVGTETRIERMASGNITDGETVQVDYFYELDGSYDYKEINQTLSLLYSLYRRYNFFLNYSYSRPMLQSGNPVRSLITVERYRFGADAQVPITKTMEYGWEIEAERRIDELHPFKRGAIEVNFTTALPFYSSIANFSSGYEYINNELSPIDVKETRYSATLSARPGWGSVASFESSYRRDIGGEELKTFTDAALQYSWQRGKLSFSLAGRYTKEHQGETVRTHAKIEAALSRYFR